MTPAPAELEPMMLEKSEPLAREEDTCEQTLEQTSSEADSKPRKDYGDIDAKRDAQIFPHIPTLDIQAVLRMAANEGKKPIRRKSNSEEETVNLQENLQEA